MTTRAVERLVIIGDMRLFAPTARFVCERYGMRVWILTDDETHIPEPVRDIIQQLRFEDGWTHVRQRYRRAA